MGKSDKFVKKYKDRLPGGKADKKKPSDFNAKDLAVGTKVESEHTSNKKLAMEIAMDHLTEDPKYYKKLKVMEKSKKLSTENALLSRISSTIEHHNRKKLHPYNPVKKSIDFRDSTVSVSSSDQQLAESASKELVSYIKSLIKSDISKIPFDKGTLTLSKREEGLYQGFFEDEHGQVIEKFYEQTVEMVAKTMEIRGLFTAIPNHDPVDEAEDRQIAFEESAKVAAVVMDQHVKNMHQDAVKGAGMTVRIKVGDVEFEVKKSLHDFVADFKSARAEITKGNVKKSLQAWRRNTKTGAYTTDLEAAEALLQGWNELKEEYYQTLFAISRMKED